MISCEDLEQTVDYNLPYTEKMVIDGQFSINSKNFSVRVTKSLPPLEELTPEKVTVSDADCKVYYKDQVVDLNYAGESMYVSNSPINIEEGVEYKLEVKWKDKFATATTTIPKIPIIKEVVVDSIPSYGGDYFKILTFIVQTVDKGMGSIVENYFYYNDSNLRLLDEVNKIYVISTGDSYYGNPLEDFTTFDFRYYDIQYYTYWVTRYEGQSDDGIFGNSGVNLEGNVKGDNTFGVWIGYNFKTDSISKYINK